MECSGEQPIMPPDQGPCIGCGFRRGVSTGVESPPSESWGWGQVWGRGHARGHLSRSQSGGGREGWGLRDPAR